MVYDNIERLFKQKEIELKASNLILRFWHYYKSCKQGNIKSQIKNYYLLQRGVRDFTIYSKKKRLKEMLIPVIEIMPSTIKNVLIKGHNLEVKVEEDNWNIKDFEEIEQDQKLLKEKMNYLEKIFQSVHKKLLENPNKLTNDQCIRLQQLVFLYNQLNKQDFSSTEDYKQAQIYPNVHKNRTLELLATQLKNKYEESNKFKRDYERIISGVGTFKTMIYRLNIIQTNMAANLNKISYRAIRKYQEKEKQKFLKKKFKHIHKHTKNDDNLDQDIVIDSSVTYLKQMSSESIFTNNNQQKNKQQDNQTSQNNQKHQFLEQKTQQINQKILDQNLHQQLIKDNQLQQKPPKKVTIQLDQDQEKIQEQHIFKSPIRQDDTLFKQNLKQQVPSDKSSDKSPNKQQLEGGKLNFDQSSLQYIKKSNLSKASQDQSLQNLFEYINFDQKKDISHPEIIHYKDKIKEIDQAYDDLINSLQDDD